MSEGERLDEGRCRRIMEGHKWRRKERIKKNIQLQHFNIPYGLGLQCFLLILFYITLTFCLSFSVVLVCRSALSTEGNVQNKEIHASWKWKIDFKSCTPTTFSSFDGCLEGDVEDTIHKDTADHVGLNTQHTSAVTACLFALTFWFQTNSPCSSKGRSEAFCICRTSTNSLGLAGTCWDTHLTQFNFYTWWSNSIRSASLNCVFSIQLLC